MQPSGDMWRIEWEPSTSRSISKTLTISAQNTKRIAPPTRGANAHSAHPIWEPSSSMDRRPPSSGSPSTLPSWISTICLTSQTPSLPEARREGQRNNTWFATLDESVLLIDLETVALWKIKENIIFARFLTIIKQIYYPNNFYEGETWVDNHRQQF